MPPAADIVLATINARYSHTSLGLRCLLANLGDLRPRATLREYAPDAAIPGIVDELAALAPRIIGLGTYIWNVRVLTELTRRLRERLPDTFVVLGGPELFYEAETHPISALADCVICGEAETSFRELCASVLEGRRPAGRFITAPREDLAGLRRPDDEYHAGDDLARRQVYVETSRGCPFACEYCLSARDREVRYYPVDATLAGIEGLIVRGARSLKFVDRTFNLHIPRAVALLDALRAFAGRGPVFQFEMVPDRFPPELRAAVRTFPAGSLRLEIGVQSFDPDVNGRVGRRMEPEAIAETLTFLRRDTAADVHADLIAGIPGETLTGFAAGFDRLLALGPGEIQVGLLKLLRGTPLDRHIGPWRMRFNPEAPYELQDSAHLPAADIVRIRNVAYIWERLSNRHHFRRSLPLLWEATPSPFMALLAWTDWLAERHGPLHSLALDFLVTQAFEYLTTAHTPAIDPSRAAEALWADYAPRGRRLPPMLRTYLNP